MATKSEGNQEMNIRMTIEKTSRPIFILGSGRSGTSILTAALKSGAEIPGFNEGHFLPLLYSVMAEVGRYYSAKEKLRLNQLHQVAHMDQEKLEDDLISVFKRQCEQIHTEEVWLDKSPTAGMIKAVPYLRRAWPEARYIFAKRRGIENVISRLKKFPNVDFETHCRQWCACMQSWLQVKDPVRGSSIEIDQRDIALQPVETARVIGDFLALNSNQVRKIEANFTGKRPQSTGSTEKETALDISQVGWTKEQMNVFRAICGEVSQAFGYTENGDYAVNSRD